MSDTKTEGRSDAELIQEVVKLMNDYANQLDAVTFPWIDEPTLTFPAALLGLSACFYFYPSEQGPEAMIWCINDYLDRVQDKLALAASSDGHFKRVTSKFVRPALAQAMHDIYDTDDAAFTFQATSSPKEDQPGHFSLTVSYDNPLDGRGILASAHFTLPAGFVIHQKQGYFDRMVVAWAQKLRPFHGTAGLGAILPVYIVTATGASASLRGPMERHPGMQVDTAWLISYCTEDGIPGVNWYTMVADELLNSIGGKKMLEEKLDRKTFALWDYPGGVGIRAAPIPVLEDSATGDFPAAYVALHRVLRPVYAKNFNDIISTLPGQDDDEAFARKWQMRYDAVK